MKKPTFSTLTSIASILGVLALATCQGCSTYQTIVAERGAEASDQATDAALWSLCSAMPVGAIKRRFKTEEERDAYNKICPDGVLP